MLIFFFLILMQWVLRRGCARVEEEFLGVGFLCAWKLWGHDMLLVILYPMYFWNINYMVSLSLYLKVGYQTTNFTVSCITVISVWRMFFSFSNKSFNNRVWVSFHIIRYDNLPRGPKNERRGGQENIEFIYFSLGHRFTLIFKYSKPKCRILKIFKHRDCKVVRAESLRPSGKGFSPIIVCLVKPVPFIKQVGRGGLMVKILTLIWYVPCSEVWYPLPPLSSQRHLW